MSIIAFLYRFIRIGSKHEVWRFLWLIQKCIITVYVSTMLRFEGIQRLTPREECVCPHSVHKRILWAADTHLQGPWCELLPSDQHHSVFLVHLKTRRLIKNKCGVILKIRCHDCSEFALGTEHNNIHSSAPTAIAEHLKQHKHNISMKDDEVVAKEQNYWKRKIREAIKTKVAQPTLNRDAGWPFRLSLTFCCREVNTTSADEEDEISLYFSLLLL